LEDHDPAVSVMHDRRVDYIETRIEIQARFSKRFPIGRSDRIDTVRIAVLFRSGESTWDGGCPENNPLALRRIPSSFWRPRIARSRFIRQNRNRSLRTPMDQVFRFRISDLERR